MSENNAGYAECKKFKKTLQWKNPSCFKQCEDA